MDAGKQAVDIPGLRYGYGYGDGDGYGYGDGYGDGYGYGYGYGHGYGDGYGYGDGDDAEHVCAVSRHDVEIVRTLCAPIVKIGCQVGTLAWWRKHWRTVADKEGVDVSDDAAKAAFAKIERRAGVA